MFYIDIINDCDYENQRRSTRYKFDKDKTLLSHERLRFRGFKKKCQRITIGQTLRFYRIK